MRKVLPSIQFVCLKHNLKPFVKLEKLMWVDLHISISIHVFFVQLGVYL